LSPDKAYREAQDALKNKEDLTFSEAEIDAFLPEPLKHTQSSVERQRNGPEIADSQLPEEALNVFAESDVIHKAVPVKEPRA
jgi:hypothetical protein